MRKLLVGSRGCAFQASRLGSTPAGQAAPGGAAKLSNSPIGRWPRRTAAARSTGGRLRQLPPCLADSEHRQARPRGGCAGRRAYNRTTPVSYFRVTYACVQVSDPRTDPISLPGPPPSLQRGCLQHRGCARCGWIRKDASSRGSERRRDAECSRRRGGLPACASATQRHRHATREPVYGGHGAAASLSATTLRLSSRPQRTCHKQAAASLGWRRALAPAGSGAGAQNQKIQNGAAGRHRPSTEQPASRSNACFTRQHQLEGAPPCTASPLLRVPRWWRGAQGRSGVAACHTHDYLPHPSGPANNGSRGATGMHMGRGEGRRLLPSA